MTSSLILQRNRVGRKHNPRKQRIGEWLIVCGGEKTEVNYVSGLIEYVNQHCDSTQKIIYKLVGLSLDPKNLVEELQRKISQFTETNPIYYSKIFVLFDKDDFSPTQIKEAIKLCDANEYICCYSNVCFETWLYLHFYPLSTYIPRKDLLHKLSAIFHSYGIDNYQKNDPNLFQKVCQYGDIIQAYKRAKQLDSSSDIESLVQEKPVTTMYRFLEEVDIRQRELELPGIHEIFHK